MGSGHGEQCFASRLQKIIDKYSEIKGTYDNIMAPRNLMKRSASDPPDPDKKPKTGQAKIEAEENKSDVEIGGASSSGGVGAASSDASGLAGSCGRADADYNNEPPVLHEPDKEDSEYD